MHELGFCDGILDAVQRRACGRTIKKIRVRFGELHRLSAQSLQQAFLLVADGTEAENATLEVVFVPARLRCRSCLTESEGAEVPPSCLRCGAMEIEVSGGDEMILESLEYESAGAKTSDPDA
jgi:hydrogenase nickel incorporation protein HypA/HybF